MFSIDFEYEMYLQADSIYDEGMALSRLQS